MNEDRGRSGTKTFFGFVLQTHNDLAILISEEADGFGPVSPQEQTVTDCVNPV